MAFRHEQLHVYQAAIQYVAWAYRLCEGLQGHRNAKDQLLRASQSIPLNIAEGNGRFGHRDRRRFFEIARGSAVECAAIQDVLQVCGALSAEDSAGAKDLLDRIVAMLTKMEPRQYEVREDGEDYGIGQPDGDGDGDRDRDGDTGAVGLRIFDNDSDTKH